MVAQIGALRADIGAFRQARAILACRHAVAAGARGHAPQLEVLVLTDSELQKWVYTVGAGAEMQVSQGRRSIQNRSLRYLRPKPFN